MHFGVSCIERRDGAGQMLSVWNDMRDTPVRAVVLAVELLNNVTGLGYGGVTDGFVTHQPDERERRSLDVRLRHSIKEDRTYWRSPIDDSLHLEISTTQKQLMPNMLLSPHIKLMNQIIFTRYEEFPKSRTNQKIGNIK
jgi:hypothetical protein